MITTLPFKVEASSLGKIILKIWSKNHFLALLTPPIILLSIGAIWDLRFIIIALMAIFIVIPLIMMLVYFYYALAPEIGYSLLPHTISCNDSGLDIIYFKYDDDIPAKAPEHISWTKIATISIDSKGIIIHLRVSPYSIIFIPESAFDNQKIMFTMEDFIAKKFAQ